MTERDDLAEHVVDDVGARGAEQDREERHRHADRHRSADAEPEPRALDQAPLDPSRCGAERDVEARVLAPAEDEPPLGRLCPRRIEANDVRARIDAELRTTAVRERHRRHAVEPHVDLGRSAGVHGEPRDLGTHLREEPLDLLAPLGLELAEPAGEELLEELDGARDLARAAERNRQGEGGCAVRVERDRAAQPIARGVSRLLA